MEMKKEEMFVASRAESFDRLLCDKAKRGKSTYSSTYIFFWKGGV